MERELYPKYKGVRKRKWGKWVSEIRLPNSRERIWLGSFDSPKKAARAFDAALYCLRGPGAAFNFPDNPPEIPDGRSLSSQEIQAVASRFANEEMFPQPHGNCARDEMNSLRGDIDDVSGGGGASEQVDNVNGGNTTVDWSFLSTLDIDVGPSDFGYFPNDVASDLYQPYPPSGFYGDGDDNFGDDDCSHHFFLWDF